VIILTIIKVIILKVYKTKNFGRFQKSERLTDSELIDAIKELEDGLVEADLGGGVFKKRIKAQGRGKSGGFRTIIAYKQGDRAIFMYGYPKNTVKKSGKEISDKELSALRDMAKILFNVELNQSSNSLIEVKYE